MFPLSKSPHSKNITLTSLLMGSALFLSACSTNHSHPELSNQQKAVAVLDSLGTTDLSPLSYISDEKYIQHNQSVATGKSGLLDFLDKMPTVEQKESSIVRAFSDGDYVVTHSYVKSFNGVVFDIFRFEEGLIVEHWDAIQPSAKPNASGRTMYDGTTKITDLALTENNKKLVKEMVETLFLKGEFNKANQFISEKTYLQHNPWFGDGLNTLLEGFKAMIAQGQTIRYETLHAVLGEGNFVLAVSEGEFNGTHMAFYDLFRVENGKVVEHWDVLQAVPPKEARKNDNGMFNFPSTAL
ncbi:nuclear transport factor 2 family protein [Marinomonas sp. THO17]|uniref:nuclear transport factor 2 family protein n=1 Tax=Marinomonas sp. THO17 TaxID=3149048 RepID=UPI00336BD7C2